jgi:hypothetical protein
MIKELNFRRLSETISDYGRHKGLFGRLWETMGDTGETVGDTHRRLWETLAVHFNGQAET